MAAVTDSSGLPSLTSSFTVVAPVRIGALQRRQSPSRFISSSTPWDTFGYCYDSRKVSYCHTQYRYERPSAVPHRNESSFDNPHRAGATATLGILLVHAATTNDSTMEVKGRFLVRADVRARHKDDGYSPILASDTSLSFWGGIDPVTAKVVDQTHPLVGETVTNTILCLPSGRGSCTASQVLLELLLHDLAPRALVLRDVDGLACVGALIAQEIFERKNMDIICLGTEGYQQLLQSRAARGKVLSNGSLLLQADAEQAEDTEGDEDDASDWLVSEENDRLHALQWTDSEEAMLRDCASQAERMALQVIFKYARLLQDGHSHQTRLSYVPIQSAHIDGCTYIGPGGLEFVRRLVQTGGKVRVPTTLNAVSTDRRRWQTLEVPRDRAMASIELGDAYLELGCQPSFTCAPYLLESIPSLGQDIAWGESNAVVYANSMLGARTEKLADYLDICCAIAGIVPAVGVHLPENRRPEILLDAGEVLAPLLDLKNKLECLDMLFPLLGHLCGTLADGKVPLLVGLESLKHMITKDHMKAFCAAYGTTGSSPLIHVAGVTPEAESPALIEQLVAACKTHRKITEQDVMGTFQTLDSHQGAEDDIQLVALGNPHLSLSECESLARLVRSQGGTKDPKVRIVACLSRLTYEEARAAGYVAVLEAFGVEFINDTCWCMLLDAPLIPEDTSARILSNSGKYAHYGPGLTGRSFRFGSLRDCVQAASTGVYLKQRSKSLPSLFSFQQRRAHSTQYIMRLVIWALK